MQSTKVVEIGPLVEEFAEEFLLILFGPEATPELKEICVIHQVENAPHDTIKVGGILTISNQNYIIEKVGNEANSNYESLGHISIYFRDNGVDDVLPGAIVVTPKIFPKVAIGDQIIFK